MMSLLGSFVHLVLEKVLHSICSGKQRSFEDRGKVSFLNLVNLSSSVTVRLTSVSRRWVVSGNQRESRENTKKGTCESFTLGLHLGLDEK